MNRNRAATTGVVNTPSAATNATNNINTDSITTSTVAATTASTPENKSSRLFNNFSNSKPLVRAQSPKVTSPPAVAEKPPPGSPAKAKRTSGNHTGVPDSPRVPVQSPRVSSQSPKPPVARGVQFGVVETIPDEAVSYPPEPPPLVPKKPLIPSRNSMSPPAPNSSSPAVKNAAATSSDQGYYLFSPDDDESSSEGDYDEDETAIGAGTLKLFAIRMCICCDSDGLAAKVIRRDSIAILAERRRKEHIASK